MISDSIFDDRMLSLGLARVAEQAAIASARLIGRGDEKAADQAAVNAMREQLNMLDIAGVVVIGEGERDEAPMLYIGEEVGTGNGPGVDFAVDPCEGTNLCAYNQRGSMAVLAASDRGGLFNAPDFYMKKLAAPPAAKGKVDIRKSATENIKILSDRPERLFIAKRYRSIASRQSHQSIKRTTIQHMKTGPLREQSRQCALA